MGGAPGTGGGWCARERSSAALRFWARSRVGIRRAFNADVCVSERVLCVVAVAFVLITGGVPPADGRLTRRVPRWRMWTAPSEIGRENM